MAAEYCIPKHLADKLVEAARAGDVIGDVEKLYGMTSGERKGAFAKHVGNIVAKDINTAFEKAMISNQKTALKNWAEGTFTPKEKKSGHYSSTLKKIEELDSEGLLTPENMEKFLEDVVADKLGVSVTAQEAQQISEKTQRLQQLSRENVNEYGLPTVEYFQAKRDLENYLESLSPTPALKVFTSVIGRATMLFSLKSPLVNIESNTINAISEGLARRIESLKDSGLLPAGSKHVLGYMSYANKVYAKTGYDVTRMYSLQDTSKRLGEDIIHSQGKGKIRKIGRFYTDVVFNKLMTAPDVAFASMHFTDAAVIKANAIARTEGLSGKRLQERVDQLFLDATKIDPQTPQGQSIREKARLEAERGTYTNKNNWSKVALDLRRILNNTSGDLRVGDQLMPFVQVPATVVGVSVDYSGILLPIEIVSRAKDALNAKGRGDPDAFKNAFDRTFIRKSVRAGLGVTIAFIASSWFEPDDFIGEYPTTEKERKLLQLKKAPTNSVRIGNHWISLDYFGPLAAPFVGMMYAKKYGTDAVDSILKYATGVGVQTSRTPGFKQFYDIYNTLQDFRPDKNNTAEDIKQATIDYVVDFFRSRTIPAFISDIAKGTDVERESGSAMDRFLMSIPGVRQAYLKEKLNIFGEVVEGEGFWNTILFGSRYKTANNDIVVEELARLAEKDQLPAITDVSKSSSRAKTLKEQIGETKFREFYVDFGKSFKEGIIELLSDSEYKDASDEERKEMINKVKQDLFDEALDDYGYEKEE